MKDELRYKHKIKRKYFQNSAREMADSAILFNFLTAYSGFDSFFIYNSFGTEADTKGIISALLKNGKEVYLPRIEGEEIVACPAGKTVKNSFGIEEPEGQAVSKVASVTVIPLLAVNERGYRLGYGRGYYDRYLKGKNTLKVGIGYSFQTDCFKENSWDIPLDIFISEKGITAYGKDAK